MKRPPHRSVLTPPPSRPPTVEQSFGTCDGHTDDVTFVQTPPCTQARGRSSSSLSGEGQQTSDTHITCRGYDEVRGDSNMWMVSAPPPRWSQEQVCSLACGDSNTETVATTLISRQELDGAHKAFHKDTRSASEDPPVLTSTPPHAGGGLPACSAVTTTATTGPPVTQKYSTGGWGGALAPPPPTLRLKLMSA